MFVSRILFYLKWYYFSISLKNEKNHSDKIQPSLKKFKIRKIEKKIENFKIKKSLINYINWFSAYNLTSKGMVLKMCLGDQKNSIKIEDSKNQNTEKKKIKFLLNKDQKKSLKGLKKFGKKFDVSLFKVMLAQEKQ